MSERESSFGSRLLNVCISILLAAIALSLAVSILQTIWPWLVLGLLLVEGCCFAWRMLRRRYWSGDC